MLVTPGAKHDELQPSTVKLKVSVVTAPAAPAEAMAASMAAPKMGARIVVFISQTPTCREWLKKAISGRLDGTACAKFKAFSQRLTKIQAFVTEIVLK